MENKLERLKDALALISHGTASFKLDENGELEYIRIDNRKFTNMNKMGNQIIDYTRNSCTYCQNKHNGEEPENVHGRISTREAGLRPCHMVGGKIGSILNDQHDDCRQCRNHTYN